MSDSFPDSYLNNKDPPFEANSKELFPLVTIIVLNFNGSKLGRIFDDCIDSLLATSYPSFEVIIVDNGSTDNSGQSAIEKRPKAFNLHLFRFEMNYGYAKGNNEAFKRIQSSEFIVFANNDIVVDRNWLRPLISAMVSDERLGVCGPVHMKPGWHAIDHAGVFCSIGGSPNGLKIIPEDPINVNYVNGACLMVRSKLFRLLGGFNSKFSFYYDETDFCERVNSLGYDIAVIPLSRIVHHSVSSFKANKLTGRGQFLTSRNRFYYLYQNRSAGDLLFAIPMSIINNLAGTIALIRKRNIEGFFASIKGVIAGLMGMKDGLSMHGRRPFKNPLTLPAVVDLLDIFRTRDSVDKTIQSIIAQKVSLRMGRKCVDGPLIELF